MKELGKRAEPGGVPNRGGSVSLSPGWLKVLRCLAVNGTNWGVPAGTDSAFGTRRVRALKAFLQTSGPTWTLSSRHGEEMHGDRD